jgi:hypothetical protein
MKAINLLNIFLLILIGCSSKSSYYLSHSIDKNSDSLLPAPEMEMVFSRTHIKYFDTVSGTVSDIPIKNDTVIINKTPMHLIFSIDTIKMEHDSIADIWLRRK